MIRHAMHVLFGLAVVGSYVAVARSGYTLGAATAKPTPPANVSSAAGLGSARRAPLFWSTGYLGGK